MTVCDTYVELWMEGDLDSISCPTGTRGGGVFLAQRDRQPTLTLRVSYRDAHSTDMCHNSQLHTCHQRFFGRVRTSFGLRLTNPTLVLMS